MHPNDMQKVMDLLRRDSIVKVSKGDAGQKI